MSLFFTDGPLRLCLRIGLSVLLSVVEPGLDAGDIALLRRWVLFEPFVRGKEPIYRRVKMRSAGSFVRNKNRRTVKHNLFDSPFHQIISDVFLICTRLPVRFLFVIHLAGLETTPGDPFSFGVSVQVVPFFLNKSEVFLEMENHPIVESVEGTKNGEVVGGAHKLHKLGIS